MSLLVNCGACFVRVESNIGMTLEIALEMAAILKNGGHQFVFVFYVQQTIGRKCTNVFVFIR